MAEMGATKGKARVLLGRAWVLSRRICRLYGRIAARKIVTIRKKYCHPSGEAVAPLI